MTGSDRTAQDLYNLFAPDDYRRPETLSGAIPYDESAPTTGAKDKTEAFLANETTMLGVRLCKSDLTEHYRIRPACREEHIEDFGRVTVEGSYVKNREVRDFDRWTGVFLNPENKPFAVATTFSDGVKPGHVADILEKEFAATAFSVATRLNAERMRTVLDDYTPGERVSAFRALPDEHCLETVLPDYYPEYRRQQFANTEEEENPALLHDIVDDFLLQPDKEERKAEDEVA